MGLPSRSYGTYCFILLIQVTQIKLIMKLSLIELIYSFGIIVGDLITRDSNLNQGIWAGMIFGGTAIQTLILAIITIRCDWEKEVKKKPSNSL